MLRFLISIALAMQCYALNVQPLSMDIRGFERPHSTQPQLPPLPPLRGADSPPPPMPQTEEQLELKAKEHEMQAQLEMQKVQKDLTGMDSFMKHVEEDMAEQQTLKGDVSRALDLFKQQVSTCDAEKQGYRGQIDRFKAEVLSLQKRIRELEGGLEQCDHDKDVLEKANKNMLGTFSGMFKNVQQAEALVHHSSSNSTVEGEF